MCLPRHDLATQRPRPLDTASFHCLRCNKRRPLRLNYYRCSVWSLVQEAVSPLMRAGMKGTGKRFRACQDKVGSDNDLASVYFVFGESE